MIYLRNFVRFFATRLELLRELHHTEACLRAMTYEHHRSQQQVRDLEELLAVLQVPLEVKR